ncbi:MAG: hypothetical protein R2748_13640 [Bryobacterales bacterium]
MAGVFAGRASADAGGDDDSGVLSWFGMVVSMSSASAAAGVGPFGRRARNAQVAPSLLSRVTEKFTLTRHVEIEVRRAARRRTSSRAVHDPEPGGAGSLSPMPLRCLGHHVQRGVAGAVGAGPASRSSR